MGKSGVESKAYKSSSRLRFREFEDVPFAAYINGVFYRSPMTSMSLIIISLLDAVTMILRQNIVRYEKNLDLESR